MDLTRFEVLETQVTALVAAFVRLQEENKQLGQSVHQLQEELTTHHRELARLQSEREELLQLRTKMQVLGQERSVIKQKLQHMLSTIEWLEERTRMMDDKV